MATIVVHPTNGSFHGEDLRPAFPNVDVVEPDAVTDVSAELERSDEPTVLLTNNSSFRHSYLDAITKAIGWRQPRRATTPTTSISSRTGTSRSLICLRYTVR